MLDKITPEQHAQFERKFLEDWAYSRWLEEQGKEYGTDTSISLDTLREAGHFPIGITKYACEELFIFHTKYEAHKAYRELEFHKRSAVGWWYSKNQFQKEISNDKYFNSKIYWLTDKIKPLWKARVGEIHTTNEGCKFTIIMCNDQQNCTIQFDDINKTILEKVSYTHILNKSIKNPYNPSVCGIGFLGVGKYKTSSSKKKTKFYTHWINMLKRCYSEKCHIKQPTYKETTICEEWKCFQVFAKWHEDSWKPWMDRTWQLDKDILLKGNKIYSPETCCFVPAEINKMFVKNDINRGEYPIGVTVRDNGSIIMQITICNKGYSKTCHTIEEAFQLYKTLKEGDIKDKANKWKNKLDLKVYDALINYKVEITD